MTTVAFIPARGGSTSIPLKNIKPICGKPLIYWTTKAASECKYIDSIVISTDSDKIEDVARNMNLPKVEVFRRNSKTATNTASTESAMLEYAKAHEFETMVLIQATSPLLTAEDLCRGYKRYSEASVDSVLSVVEDKRFYWGTTSAGAHALNYDFQNRPRRQDFEGCYVENGAFYITKRKNLLKDKCRLSGRIGLCPMSEDTAFEIDEPSDWIIVESLLLKRIKSITDKHIPQIRMFLTDCDGCLTDAGMYYAEDGNELKKFNTKDGMGIARLREAGIITGIITSEDTDIVRARARKLRMDEVYLGVFDKLIVVKALAEKYQITLQEIAYVGDDINDLETIKAVGFGCSVHNGLPAVKRAARYVSTLPGGEGAIREIADLILQQ